MTMLVLLPGLDGTGELFADFVSSAEIHNIGTVVGSYPTDVPLDYRALEPIARSFLPSDEPFYLLAESFSGPLGISIAATSPPGLLGLILCCSFARNPRPAFRAIQPAFAMLPFRSMPDFVVSRFLLGRFTTPSLRTRVAQALAQVSPAVLRTRLRSVLAVDVSAKVRSIWVPMLYLRATEDWLVPRSAGESIAGLASQTTIVEFAAPHGLLQVIPARVAERVKEFVQPSR